MTKPLVSIIIPFCNAEKYLEETINSAINQTWANKEIILINDGSTDNSPVIAKKFENAFVKVFHQENKGASAARNKGLSEAKGDYIQFLDADDILSEDKIKGQVKTLNGSLTQLSICKTVHFFDGTDHLKKKPQDEWFYAKDYDDPVDFLIKLYSGGEVMQGYGGMVQPNAWLTPKRIIEQAGPWNENLSIDDDGEFFCRVILQSQGIKFSSKGLNYYRKFRNNNSLSAQKNLKAFNSIVLATNLKYAHLKAKANDIIVDRVFGRHYWLTGVSAFPYFKKISRDCIRKGKELNYNGKKYYGGPASEKLANLLGWKVARYLTYYNQTLKKSKKMASSTTKI